MQALIIIDMQQGMASPAAEFQPRLAPLAREHVVLAGVSTNNSVEASARSADDVHYMALSNLDGEYAAIRS